MSNKSEPKPEPSALLYQIRIKGHLDKQWTDWFEGMTIAQDNDNTLLTGTVVDQAALYGLLKKVRDLGMPLVSVNRVRFNETDLSRSNKEPKLNVKT